MAIHQAIWVLAQLLGEELRELVVVDGLLLVLIHHVAHHVDLRVEDDAKQPVASHHGGEELRLLLAADLMDAAVRQHDPQRTDRGGQ